MYITCRELRCMKQTPLGLKKGHLAEGDHWVWSPPHFSHNCLHLPSDWTLRDGSTYMSCTCIFSLEGVEREYNNYCAILVPKVTQQHVQQTVEVDNYWLTLIQPWNVLYLYMSVCYTLYLKHGHVFLSGHFSQCCKLLVSQASVGYVDGLGESQFISGIDQEPEVTK